MQTEMTARRVLQVTVVVDSGGWWMVDGGGWWMVDGGWYLPLPLFNFGAAGPVLASIPEHWPFRVVDARLHNDQ